AIIRIYGRGLGGTALGVSGGRGLSRPRLHRRRRGTTGRRSGLPRLVAVLRAGTVRSPLCPPGEMCPLDRQTWCATRYGLPGGGRARGCAAGATAGQRRGRHRPGGPFSGGASGARRGSAVAFLGRPWVLRHRKVVPPEVESGLRLLEIRH